MTTISLTKHHGLGNDFLVVFDPPDTDLPALARRLCDRRRGVGADGLLVGTVEPGFDARMVLYNADGSRAEMSGNGIRCFAQAVAARLPVGVDSLRILTDAGPRVVDVVEHVNADEILAAVDMGEVAALAEPADWHRIGVDPLRPVRHLSVGNPHSVVCVDCVADVDLVALGQIVPYVNLEIVEPGPQSGAITMRVHERGAGITEACGTGACASAWSACEWGLVSEDEEIVVHMDGGDAKVRVHHPSRGRVTLVGPATYVGVVTVPLD
jgi:diaminopimelate epimerase